MLGSLVLVLLLASGDAPQFKDHFIDKALRADVHHFGTAGKEFMSLHALKEQPHFAGPRTRLVDDANLGSHRVQLLDEGTGAVIFQRGFCTLFGEWRTTPEALEGHYRVFEHTLILPYPKRDMILSVSSRDASGAFMELMNRRIVLEPSTIAIEEPPGDLKAVKLMVKGKPEDKVDIVILGDGYTAKEMKQYLRDARDAMEGLLGEPPFKEQYRKFNFWAVESPSAESGVDEPRKGIYRSTRLDTAFNTFEIARYSMTTSIHAIHDVAAVVPCDHIIILFNSSRFGGGGIYNLYAMVTGNQPSAGVLAHEMGHCMAGLGDEYYTSSVSYVDYYKKDVEPWERNITTLAGGRPPKWSNLIPEGTPIPTPPKAKYGDVVGCFEGAGYQAEGLYRPCRDCIMKSCRNGYCPVCKAALEETIVFYTK